MTLEDQIQHGLVVHVGFRSDSSESSIRKTSNGLINLKPGGVIGDHHFQYEVTLGPSKNKVKIFDYPEILDLVQNHNAIAIQTHQFLFLK